VRRALPVLAAALLLAGLAGTATPSCAKRWQGDVPGRHERVRRGEGGRRPGSPRGGGAYTPAPAEEAARSAWDLVWKSETANQQVSLRGRVQTRAFFGTREEHATARIVAARGKLRLDYESNGKRWTLLDDGRNLIRLRPGSEPPVILPRPAFVTDRTLAERNYAARVVREAQVAGRPTQVIEIASRASGAPAWRLWLDRETRVALKRERYNVEGRLTAGTEYSTVQFGAPVSEEEFSGPAQMRAPEEGVEKSLGPEALSQAVGFAVQTPSYLPAGYALRGGYARRTPKGGGPGRHGALSPSAELRYTDGLRVLSVRQWEAREEGARQERRQQRKRWRGRKEEEGRLLDHGSEKVYRSHLGERVVVVVGDLPEEELARVARSLAPNRDKPAAR
jgi:negative regulator of sigma E activity